MDGVFLLLMDGVFLLLKASNCSISQTSSTSYTDSLN